MLKDHTQSFLDLAVRYEALRFGEFTLKSGRVSPYFFNAGVFADGEGIDGLARCYAQALIDSNMAFDQLFGPAYKGIPLVAVIALTLWRDFGINVPYVYNRKEAKDHGEGGLLVGPPLQGRVVIVDDVISAGTSVAESMQWIESANATPSGVLIALDRQERGVGSVSAVQAVEAQGLQVASIAKLADLIAWLKKQGHKHLGAMEAYQATYGA
jgi:orotate phosphoribosyltransferase